MGKVSDDLVRAMNDGLKADKLETGIDAKIDNGNSCVEELEIGDDFGDNSCTFHCQLEKGHKGPHIEEFTHEQYEVDGKIYCVMTWIVSKE